MRVTDKIMGIRRAVAMLVIAVGFVSGSHAYKVSNPEVEVDGVRYMLDFYTSDVREQCLIYDNIYRRYCLRNLTKSRYNEISWICAVQDMHDEDDPLCKTFVFQDGSEIPTFEYVTRIISPNSPSPKASLPRYEAEKDEMMKRHPYYVGDVWLQDSVLMPALPDLRKSKYHIVCDISGVKFNRELTSIRTPRYAVVRSGTFKNCIGLKTARIGAAQLVEGYSFENCINLETVIFESVPLVYDFAFLNCPNIRTVVVEGDLDKVKESHYDAPFSNNVYRHATLYVRKDQIDDYRKHESWGKFHNIRDIEEYYMSGVGSVNADAQEEYQIYNVSGVLVRRAADGQDWREGLPSGVYIVKSSLGTVRKEYIK